MGGKVFAVVLRCCTAALLLCSAAVCFRRTAVLLQNSLDAAPNPLVSRPTLLTASVGSGHAVQGAQRVCAARH